MARLMSEPRERVVVVLYPEGSNAALECAACNPGPHNSHDSGVCIIVRPSGEAAPAAPGEGGLDLCAFHTGVLMGTLMKCRGQF